MTSPSDEPSISAANKLRRADPEVARQTSASPTPSDVAPPRTSVRVTRSSSKRQQAPDDVIPQSSKSKDLQVQVRRDDVTAIRYSGVEDD